MFLLLIFLESLKRLLSHNCRSARILLILDRPPQSQRPESRIPIAEQFLFLVSQSDELSVSDLIFNRNCGNFRLNLSLVNFIFNSPYLETGTLCGRHMLFFGFACTWQVAVIDNLLYLEYFKLWIYKPSIYFIYLAQTPKSLSYWDGLCSFFSIPLARLFLKSRLIYYIQWFINCWIAYMLVAYYSYYSIVPPILGPVRRRVHWGREIRWNRSRVRAMQLSANFFDFLQYYSNFIAISIIISANVRYEY